MNVDLSPKFHPSYAGFQCLVAENLELDGVSEGESWSQAQEICNAVWALSKLINRDDIPATAEFLRRRLHVISS